MNFFISDFSRAASAAKNFDSKIRAAATAISSDYADLVDLSTRQVFGTVEITVGKDAMGNWNTSDVQAFMDSNNGWVLFYSYMHVCYRFSLTIFNPKV